MPGSLQLPEGLNNSLPRWLTHMVGKLVLAVGEELRAGGIGSFPSESLHRESLGFLTAWWLGSKNEHSKNSEVVFL